MKLRFASFSLLFLLSVSSALYLQPIASMHHTSITTRDEQYYLPPAAWLTVFSVGYNEAIADIIWTKFVVYFASIPKLEVASGMKLGDTVSNQLAQKAEENHTINYVHAVTRLDSRFKAAYSHGARLTMYHKGIITRQTVRMAIDILEEGVRNFPEDGDLRFNLGFLYYYELVPFAKNKNEKTELKNKGTNILYKAARLPGAPPYATELASTLLSRQGMNRLAIEHLNFMLLTEKEPEIRTRLEKELSKLVGKEMKFQHEKMKQFIDHWKTEFAFIPFDLYTVLFSHETGNVALSTKNKSISSLQTTQ